MAYSVIRIAILGAWLCAPAFAQTEGRDTGLGSPLPGDATAQLGTEEERGQEGSREQRGMERRGLGGRQDVESGEERPEDLREAPGAAPGTAPGGRVAPGQQPYRGAPGTVEPGTEGEVPVGTPEPGRRWGLIVFVIAIVALGLLAFRRRGPTPPAP